MPTKIELRLEQSQQSVSNDVLFTSYNKRVLRIILEILPEHPSDTQVFTMKMEILLEPTSNKLLVVTNRFTHIVLSALRRSDIENKLAWLVLTEPKDSYKDGDGDASFQQNLPLRYQVYQGRLLASFQDDAKYEHVGQDTRSQGGKDDQDKQGKDLEISKSKTKSKDNDKGSRSKITQHEGTSLQHNKDQEQDSRTQCQSNLKKSKTINLRGNIIGKGQICDNKCRVTFSEHDIEITKDGKVIGRGIRKKGLYVMKLGNKPKYQICLETIDENSTLWHRRLGHANMRLIQSLASKKLVRNLPKLKFDQHFCDACKIGKQAHVSHKVKNIVSTTRCLELLHMDLFGPSAIRSNGGNRYTLVIVDDYSREFDNEVQFGEFCNANGITHNFSVPRTPQSNGMVERKNKTLQEMRKTPYELLRGRKPTLDYFKVFGSKCFILNTKDYLTKFDPKSYEGVFLGYSQNSKAYIILNKHTRKVKESLNVTFDETPPPSKTSPSVYDDLDEEEAIKVTEKKNLENDIKDETLEIDEIVNIKESRNHPLENIIGNLNQRTLRSQAQNQSNFFCFISTLEPKNMNEALTDKS
ncbi:retrovirus-related pol polyprotein from transposon TNT 1-94 [Tanacetum coccineum]